MFPVIDSEDEKNIFLEYATLHINKLLKTPKFFW